MRRDRIKVERGEMPPQKMTVEGTHFTFESTHYNKIDNIMHFVYRAESGWLISFTDRQFAVGLEVDPNRKSDWWAGEDNVRSAAAKSKAAKSVPHTKTSPAWSIQGKTKKKQEAQTAPKKKRTRNGGKVKSEDLFL